MSQWKKRKKYTVELNDHPKERFHFTKFMKRQSKLMVLSIFGVALLLLGSSYAVFSSVSKSKGYQVIKVGTLNIIYADEGGTINLNGAYPVSDEEGMKSTGYKFTIENKGSLAASYKIKIKDDNQAIESLGLSIEELMNHEMLKYSINGEAPVVLSSVSSNDDIIFQGSLLPGEKKEYEVKLWIKSDATNEVLGKHYHGKIVVEGEQAYNDITGANTPELIDGMIPVVYKEGNWVKADLTEEWYNYGKQEWANAVTVDANSNLIDLSGKGNYGKVVGGTKSGDSITLDGVDDYIDCGFANYDFKDSLTLVLRVKFNVDNKETNVFNNFEGAGLGISRLVSGEIAYQVHSNGSYHMLTSSFIPQLNQYYTLVMSYDGSSLKLYVNGVPVTAKDGSEQVSGNIKISPVPILIGANPQKNSTPVSFTPMDFTDVLIFDRGLTEEEIKSNYKDENINVTNKDQLLMHYKVDQGVNRIEANDVIPTDMINAMYVWIPRYSYTIKSEDGSNYYGRSYQELGGISPATKETPGAIDIKFVSKDEPVDNGSAKYTGNSATNWYTHPGFCFGTLTTPDDRTTCDGEEVNGIWVGKFENAPIEGSSCAAERNEANCNNSTTKTVIKPQEPMYNWINFSNAFETIRKMQTENYSYYGLPNPDNDTYDIHMMKGMEWGSATYLSQSIYGKYGNPSYTGENKEVYYNYYQNYQTGCSNGSPKPLDNTICIPYNEEQTGTGASTTGNITGIYDMNGGLWDKVMSFMKYEDGSIGYAKSGFTSSTFPESKYYDLYPYHTSPTDYSNYYKGDGLMEFSPDAMKGWYNDYADSFYCRDSNYKAWEWIFSIRGGTAYNLVDWSGIFAFGRTEGEPRINETFRTVLKP